jgi:uncharacterized sulfatase
MANPEIRQAVLLVTDTTRWDMLNCYRDTGLRTPNLDGLAATGVRFERAYTCSPVCAPSRSAMLTGTWPHGNGVWANNLPLGTSARTIGQMLSDHGVRTAFVGKWHLDGTDYFGSGRCPDGWDDRYWYDGRRHLEELSPRRRTASRRESRGGAVPAELTFAHRCSDRAIDFIETHAAEPFLLVVSYDEPHGPSISPDPYAHAYDDFEFPATRNVLDTLSGKPEHQRVWSGSRRKSDRRAVKVRMPAFFGSQTFVDSEIGRVLAAVGAHCPDALVCYTSDHGDALESHSLTGKGPALYDEIARVPLLLRWPGLTPAGAVHRFPASHIDLVPTLLAAFGAPAPPLLDGHDMRPVLAAPATAAPHRYVFSEFGRYEVDHDGFGGFQPLRGIVGERHKLVINLLSGDELYDLGSDPGEFDNLIESPEHAGVRDQMHDRLLDWMHETRDPFRGYQWERRPWRTDAPPPTWDGRGMTRQRDDDGRLPRMLDYDTGLPMEQATRPKPPA